MMKTIFRGSVVVTYGQICVFDHGMETPFNDWRDEDVAQGFAWRPGSVSFDMLNDGGQTDIAIFIASSLQAGSDAERAILVPFHVPSSGEVEIATVDGESTVVRVAPGPCGVLFEHGRKDSEMWCRFTFAPGLTVNPEILVADPSLQPQYPLRMDAAPAI